MCAWIDSKILRKIPVVIIYVKKLHLSEWMLMKFDISISY